MAVSAGCVPVGWQRCVEDEHSATVASLGRLRDTDGVEILSRTFEQLDRVTAYRLWELRSSVFVVEQECVYLDLDGRDVEPGTRHVYAVDAGRPVACLRVLDEPDGAARIGRVCVAGSHRATGLAGRLMDRVLGDLGDRVIVLDAQVYLEGWYAGLGFVRTGPDYLDDGIPHVPMRRTRPYR